MSGIFDVPAFIPEPKNARIVRPLDDPPDQTLRESLDMNNKSASIRALLHQSPDGLGYDELSKHTGIARDRISAFVSVLITAGDVKPYELPGRGRVFKYVGDPKRVGPRVQIEAEKKTSTPGAAQRSTVETPKPPEPVLTVVAKDRPPIDSPVPQADRPEIAPSIDPADAIAPAGKAAAASAPARPIEVELLALSTELVIAAAGRLGIEVRALIADVGPSTGMENIESAVKWLEHAAELYGKAKAMRT